MDLELSDEQKWLAESVETLLSRHGERETLWSELVDFGALTVGDDGLGAIELCLIARALGKHLAVAPFIGSAAIRWAAAPYADSLPAAFPALSETDASVAVADVEARSSSSTDELRAQEDGDTLDGHKLAVEQADAAEVLRHHAYRTVGEFLSGGAVGPESSVVKLLMAEAEQRVAATAFDLLGDDEFWEETYLYSRAASVYGGTQQIQRSIIADRVLGLPKE